MLIRKPVNIRRLVKPVIAGKTAALQRIFISNGNGIVSRTVGIQKSRTFHNPHHRISACHLRNQLLRQHRVLKAPFLHFLSDDGIIQRKLTVILIRGKASANLQRQRIPQSNIRLSDTHSRRAHHKLTAILRQTPRPQP